MDLTHLPPIEPGIAALAEELTSAHGYLAKEKAEGTRACYRSDFKIFKGYCAERGLCPMPASAEAVMGFISAEARRGAKASSIGRRIAAIRYAHRLAGHEPPTNQEAVKATLRGIRRSIGVAPIKKAPATADLVRQMLDRCPDTLKGKRDRALLALGFAGAFRRSELVALEVQDLTETASGIRVLIRKSKTDQEGLGQEVAILRGTRLKPVQALQDWLDASGITAGRIFRPVGRGGVLKPGPLGAEVVGDLVKLYCKSIGQDPARFAAHSLRSGFLTTGAEAGVSVFKLMEISRHKSVDTLRGYVRRADIFKDHAGAAFL